MIGVKLEGLERPIPRNELIKRLANNDLNLYVTFSECAPMLPLESFEVGVPCLTGNNHHYFKNTELEKKDTNNINNKEAIQSNASLFTVKKEEILDKLSFKDKTKLLSVANKMSAVDVERIRESLEKNNEKDGQYRAPGRHVYPKCFLMYMVRISIATSLLPPSGTMRSAYLLQGSMNC